MPDDKNKEKRLESGLTPEEKLFKVIASPNKDYHITQSDPASNESDPGSELQEADPFARLENLWQRIKGFFSSGPTRPARGQSSAKGSLQRYLAILGQTPTVVEIVKVKNINRFLMILIALMGAYLVMDMILLGNARLRHFKKTADSKSPTMENFHESQGPLIPELSHYLEPAEARNVFAPPEPKRAAVHEGAEAGGYYGGPPPVALKLVGISWDRQGFVAMVEREGQNAAIFIREGDTLESGFKVKKISEQSVIYTNGQQEWELA